MSVETIVPLASEHVDAAAHILTSQFCSRAGDPITLACGESYDDFYPWIRLQSQRSAKQGLSTVCLVDGEVVAGILERGFKSTDFA